MPSYTYDKYNLTTDRQCKRDIDLELLCYLIDWPVEKGGLGREGHFVQIVNLLWGPKNKVAHFRWHPWAERMNWAAHAYQYCGFSGSASSGKSDYLAVRAIVDWLSAPKYTLVLVTTTGLKDAQRRIWGAIEKYWMAAPGLPGKMVSSRYKIYTESPDGTKLPGQCGIDLVAGDRTKEKESMSKLIGAKARRVLFIADEMPDLSPNLLLTAKANLVSNRDFAMIAAGNFKSRYDPFGEFVEPKLGWDSITVEDEGWETNLGYCLHFDGTKSPNILAGEDIYKGIYSSKTLAAHKRDLGEHTAEFWRMCRSFEAPIGMDDCIYSESDLVAGEAYQKMPEDLQWLYPPTPWTSLDPAFTNGGDRCVQTIGYYGKAVSGQFVIYMALQMILTEDVRILNKTRSRQIAEAFRANAERYNVDPQHAALDATAGGGMVLADYIGEVWSTKVLRVDFSGAPSDGTVGAFSDRLCKDAYDRRVTELWMIGLEFIKSKQLKGITPEVAREMKARKKDSVKGAAGLKMRVETKTQMKERLGFSPDKFDSLVVGIDLCRQRLGAVAGAGKSLYHKASTDWQKQVQLANRIYANGKHLAKEALNR